MPTEIKYQTLSMPADGGGVIQLWFPENMTESDHAMFGRMFRKLWKARKPKQKPTPADAGKE